MKKYKVLSLAVSGLNNRILRNPDIVTESDFPQGHVEELVKQGHLEEIKEEEIPATSKQKPKK